MCTTRSPKPASTLAGSSQGKANMKTTRLITFTAVIIGVILAALTLYAWLITETVVAQARFLSHHWPRPAAIGAA